MQDKNKISELSTIQIHRKTGSEKFYKNGKELDISLLDFWQWSASDILNNTSRGILAEFIVATSLNLDCNNARSGWHAYDLLLPDATSIEVKSSAYVQSWNHKELSKISFDIRKTREWNEQTNELSKESKRQADIYVFCLLGTCLLKHKDGETIYTLKGKINPLNLDQWKFYIVPASRLDEKFDGKKRISIESLKKVEPHPVGYDEIRGRIEELAMTIRSLKHKKYDERGNKI